MALVSLRVSFVFVFVCLAALAQPQLRVEASLVLIPAHVTNALGVAVTDLSKDDFRLFEDNVEQKITYFIKDDAPLSVGLLFDTSGSMRNKMHRSSEAAARFFKTANPQDEFFLVEFNERPKLAVSFTTDAEDLNERIARTRPFGRTSLLDAIHLALWQMKNAHHSRKAIVILSDGGDNRSRHTAPEIKNAMVESDVQLYAMGIFDRNADTHKRPLDKRPLEEQNGPQLLNELAQQSGGRHFPVNSLDDLPAISAQIGNELRNQYLFGYSSTNPSKDGKYRQVKLTVRPPKDTLDLRTYYRRGYYSPVD
jgi:Ca-activated chloride channel family protein